MRNPETAFNARRQCQADVALSTDDERNSALVDSENLGDLLLSTRQAVGDIPQSDSRFFDSHASQCLRDRKQLSTVFLCRSIRPRRDSVSDMHEGKKLRELLADRGVSQSALAAKAGVERAAVNRWLGMEEFNRSVWQKARKALAELGLDPSDIRRDDRTGPREHFIPELEKWDESQLHMLKRIMLSSQESQKEVLVYLTGALRNR